MPLSIYREYTSTKMGLTWKKMQEYKRQSSSQICSTLLSWTQDGKISYDEFATMMKAGTDWRKASRQYSRERFSSVSAHLIKEQSLSWSSTYLSFTVWSLPVHLLVKFFSLCVDFVSTVGLVEVFVLKDGYIVI